MSISWHEQNPDGERVPEVRQQPPAPQQPNLTAGYVPQPREDPAARPPQPPGYAGPAGPYPVNPMQAAPGGPPSFQTQGVPVINVSQSLAVNVAGQRKSVGLAFLLAFLFGPLGMLYSTVTGALVMLLVDLVILIPTVGFGLLVTWPICVIWAVVAANSQNEQNIVAVPSGPGKPMH